jgi:DNA replication licensing factor MCM4
MSSSSPTRGARQQPQLDNPPSSSNLFLRSSNSTGRSTTQNVSRRGDIHSDVLSSTATRRRRMFVDENGMPVRDEQTPGSEATFSNLNPDTSEADVLGGDSTRVIWGTNISIQDSMSAFKNFLYNYAKKYRMWADGATEEETEALGGVGDEKEYIDMLNNMRGLGVNGLNLDARNLKAYPSTLKLWHQLYAYPQEIIPLMDQTIKDVMVELAEKEQLQLQQSARDQSRGRVGSSVPPVPSSELDSQEKEQAQPIQTETTDLVAEVETRTYKVLPFGLDKSVNMRDLNPAGQFNPPLVEVILTKFQIWTSW